VKSKIISKPGIEVISVHPIFSEDMNGRMISKPDDVHTFAIYGNMSASQNLE
jgi:hypothetical protein